MTQEGVQKSLTEQILDAAFAKAGQHKEFDQAIVDNLGKLAKNGDLAKPDKLAEILRPASRREQ
jgi:hypothetical protein